MSDNRMKTVLITGATKGIGLAIAIRFATEGYQPIITYAWGSVPEDEVLDEFRKRKLNPPLLVQADVINEDDTDNLLELIREKYGKVNVFISGVSFSNVIRGIDDYSEKALLKSIEYSAWPMVGYTQKMKKVFGAYPEYIIGLSSIGPDRFLPNYDFASVTKSLMETFVKYLNYHFFDQKVNFNIVRARTINTDNLISTFGEDWTGFTGKYDTLNTKVSVEEVAKFVFILCSGLMDAVRGQTIMLDKGHAFSNSIEQLYMDREALGI